MKLQDLPIAITWLRVALIPLFVLIYYLPFEGARFTAMVVFVIAALTDWLDGYLARRLEATSPFGAFLDPVADKLIVAVALVMVAVEYQNLFITLATMVIILREVAVSALREWMAQQELSDLVAVSNIGKYKTTFQLVALAMLIYGGSLFGVPWAGLGFILLLVAALLTIWSFVQYSLAAWPRLG